MKPELKLVENTGSQLEAEAPGPELPPQQSEMPFAVVEGEPVTELPRDLYIPPDALQVFLEAFEGPLDLLLYLIRRQNLDILNIPIAEITRQYMKYIEVMAELQLELAGEYLLMAAMLAEIKSRMLLPRPPSAEGQDEEDPRAELVRRLQEYERFKKAAEDIDRLSRLERDTMVASAEMTERRVVKMLPQVTLREMLLALKDVLTRAEMFAHHHVARERLSVRQRMSEILSGLQEVAFVDFTALFRAQEGRMGVTVTFIAILELMKEGLIEIVQAQAYAVIHVRPAAGQRQLKVVDGGAAAADAENQAALAQPAHPDENDLDDEDEPDDAEDPSAADPPGSDDPGGERAASDLEITDAPGVDAAGIDPIGADDSGGERAASDLEIGDPASVPSDAGQDSTPPVQGEQTTSAAADTMAVVTNPADNAEEQPTADRDSSHERT
jgi:chromatin segregation and condensation protein Rec8/ScpA/Scc1 (kleisin family)